MKNPAPHPMADTPRLKVDLQALAHNWHTAHAAFHGQHLGAVVKYDAYGLGMNTIARELYLLGCRNFWVENASEGLALRLLLDELGTRASRIFVLNGLAGLGALAAHDFAQQRLIPVLTHVQELLALKGYAARQGARLPVAVHLDTGLSRLGLQACDLPALASGSAIWQDLRPIAWVSHLGRFHEPQHRRCQAQRQLFEQWTAQLPPAERSLAASSCVFAPSHWHFDHARAGSALYGVCTTPQQPQPLQIVAQLQAPVLRVAEVPAGSEIGYGGKYLAASDMRIATVAIGYGDGLPFHWHQPGCLWLAGRPAPIVGGIAMGLLSLDVSAFAADEIQAGMWAEVYGAQQPVEQLAAQAGIATNALLLATARQAQRSYTRATQAPAAA